jgi:hypothetical protein
MHGMNIKLTCVYSKCRDHLYQLLQFTVDYHTILNERPHFKYVNDSAVQQINLKKETWIACVLMCQPVVAELGPFRNLSRKLPCDHYLQACWAKWETTRLSPHGKRTIAKCKRTNHVERMKENSLPFYDFQYYSSGCRDFWRPKMM